MADFALPFHAFHHWFAERGISHEGLTVILNFKDRDEAIRFEAEMQREWADRVMPRGRINIRDFEIIGFKVKVESEVHSDGA